MEQIGFAPKKSQKRNIYPEKPGFAHEFRLTLADGSKEIVVRTSRRRTVEKVTREVRISRPLAVEVEHLRPLSYREYREHLEAIGRPLPPPAPEPLPPVPRKTVPVIPERSPSERIPRKNILDDDVRLLARRVAALDGRDPTAPLSDLIRPVLARALVELARKIAGASESPALDDSKMHLRTGT